MKKPLLLLLITLLSFITVNAQTDNEFWFVAPEATLSHGDNPVVIRIAALAQAATVTIDQPANLGFTPITVTVPANTASTVDLTPSLLLGIIENKPGDQVLNYGIRILSTALITAYYELNTSCNCNPEIFALKGRNALGTEFYTPFQNFWSNGGYTPEAKSAFDIVATEDNTTITITPSQNILGHAAGTPFTITLNKGQTYSAVASGITAGAHLGGSKIVSDKPIAVTIKDDSVANNGCRDMMGDQIVPTSIIGTEYIVMKGFLNANADEQVFILGTQNNTDIFIDGSGTPAATINIGQTFAYPITNASTYINTSQPVYVLHASGFGCELASALLPPINCTGSQSVYFIRSTAEQFGLNIMVRTGNEGNFLLNGSNTLVQATDFAPVPGTGNSWLAAQIQFNTLDVPVNVTGLLTNTSTVFHMGLINGDVSSGCRYGYFSNYSQLNIGPDIQLCPGNSALLDAGPGYETYLWSTGDTTQAIAMPTPGTYYVSVTRFGCTATDTIEVVPIPAPALTLNQDTVVCFPNALVTIDAGPGYDNYVWNTGETTQAITVGPGTYIVTVTNSVGCSSASLDTANVILGTPNPVLGQDTTICDPNSNVTLDAGPGFTNYAWSNGDNTQIISVPPGSYFVTVTTQFGCVGASADSITISVQQTIADFFNSADTTLVGLPIQFTDSSEAGTGNLASWLWDFGDGQTSTEQNPQHIYGDSGTYNVTLIVTNSEGCVDTFTVQVVVIELPVVVPNVFTPNGDGANDLLVFGFLDSYPGSKLYLYNRWGKLIYQNADYKNDWDGDNNSAGVYYFILEVNYPEGVSKKSGTVTLLK